MAKAKAERSPARIAQWLDDLRAPPLLSTYATLDDVAQRLIRTNPRLPLAKARFLAQHWAKLDDTGRFHLLADPAHKVRGPLLYRLDEGRAGWATGQGEVLRGEGGASPHLAAMTRRSPAAAS